MVKKKSAVLHKVSSEIRCPLCGKRCLETDLVSHPEDCDIKGCPQEKSAEGIRHCGCFYHPKQQAALRGPLKTYTATYSTKGEQTVFIHNCRSAADARRKLLLSYSVGNKDVDPVGDETLCSFPRSAKIEFSKTEDD